MNIRVTSWNTFGASISKISEVSKSLISNNHLNILLIQEAGATDSECSQLIGEKNIKIGRKEFKGFFKDDERANNKRCTTGILVEKELYDTAYVKFDSLQIKEIGRPVVFCTLQPDNYSPLYIATIHATASSKVSVKEMNILNDQFGRLARRLDWEWIVMGDFNAPPEKLTTSGIPENNIIHPDEFTHINISDPSKNAILDYAIVSDSLTGLEISCNEYPGTSDHIPIHLDLHCD